MHLYILMIPNKRGGCQPREEPRLDAAPWRRVGLASALALLLLVIPGVQAWGQDAEWRRTPYYDQQVTAARLVLACQDAIKDLRLSRGTALDPRVDPNQTGMLGESFSALTTCFGSLRLKRTTANPNFGALFVRYFKQLLLKEGDVIAIGTTGSFPRMAR